MSQEFLNSNEHYSEDDERDFHIEKSKKNAEKSKTPTIDHFGRDFTEKARNGEFDPVVGRESEILQVIEILNKRKKNNPVLVGPPGVGKSAVVEGLAQRIASGEGIDSSFENCRVIELSLTTLVAGTKYRGQFEERIDAILREAAEDKNIILFIDELHTVIGAGGTSGSMDASNMLKPALARGEVKVIGATTFDEYHKHIEKDKAFERRFQRVVVDKPTKEETIDILNNIKSKYEEHHGVSYSDEILDEIYKFSERYVTSRNNPDKSIDLMDEVGSKIKIHSAPNEVPEHIRSLKEDLEGLKDKLVDVVKDQDFEEAARVKDSRNELEKKIEEEESKWKSELKQNLTPVTFEDIAKVISSHTGIPVDNLSEDELDRLLEMPKVLSKNLINQDEAVTKVSQAIQRSKTGVRDPKKPLASFLFLGTTGVGKCIKKNSLITVKNKHTGKIEKISIGEFKDIIS